MPAIQPARLKKQAVDLAANFNQPVLFVRELRALLERYTDHTHRSGQAGEPFPLMGAFNTPPPVMRQVWIELSRQIKLHPEATLPLCDALWAEPNYDLQILSARLLGQVSIQPPDPVLKRLQAWINPGLDKRLLDGLLEQSLEQFFLHTPKPILELVSNWLTSSEINLQQAGLRALLPLINHSGREYLPAIYRLITPYLRLAPALLRPDILAVLSALVHASPSETAFVLRQNLTAPDNPDTAWLIRQVIEEFPDEMKFGLRAAMKVTIK